MIGAFRKYNRVLLGLVASIVLAICGLAIYMEPLRGDLTRIGGYLENDYGWQGEQDCFAEPLFTWATSTTDYDRYYDIVLLGDSFSKPTDVGGWQNYLVAATGLSMIAFSTDVFNIPALLNSPGFRNHPPRVFIYELVERNLWFDHRTFLPRSNEPAASKIPSAATPFVITPLADEPTPVARLQRDGWFPEIDLDAASSFLYKAALRKLLGINTTKTVRLDLTRALLFSSRASRSLLVYDDDFLKAEVSRADVAIIAASISARARSTEANGQTRFVTMIAPDKLSAYADFLDPEYANLSIIPTLAEWPDLNLVRLDTPLRAAIRTGEVDVYLPNDTHWAMTGCRIAAREVRAHLIEQGILYHVK